MKRLMKHEKREMVEAILDDFDFDAVFKAMENVEWSWKPTIIQLVRKAEQLLYGVLDLAELSKAKGDEKEQYIKKFGNLEAIFDNRSLSLRFVLSDSRYVYTDE